MNEVIQNILNRRSIRVYSTDQIKQEDLELVLESGLHAPSGCNAQPWHFTVVQNKEIMNTLSVESKKELLSCGNEYFKKMGENEKLHLFYNAPTIIIVSAEKSAITGPIDCAAGAENMSLAAESLNIGTCWIGLIAFLFRSPRGAEYMKMLGIPEGYEPQYALTLGYKKFPSPKPLPRRENTVNYIK